MLVQESSMVVSRVELAVVLDQWLDCNYFQLGRTCLDVAPEDNQNSFLES